nr:RecName: Full=Phospholipase A2; Short=svPLA2; AltName: Full=Phosphatidylcholine 2-acylhydrolase [Austrelaps superbus]
NLIQFANMIGCANHGSR